MICDKCGRHMDENTCIVTVKCIYGVKHYHYVICARVEIP